MKKYAALCVGSLLLFSLGAVAQTATGNAADSVNPRSDVINAQNFHRNRTVEGCVVQHGSDYLVVPKHGRPLELISASSSTEDLSQNVGHQVKVSGSERIAGEPASDDANYSLAAQHIDVLGDSCPANWNSKWINRYSNAKP